MALTNAQFDDLMRSYDQKRMRARSDADRRLAEVCERIPAYRDADEQIAALGRQSVQLPLDGDNTSVEALRSKIKALSDKKRMLLKDAGYTEDYPEPRYTCAECQDTGFLADRTKCRCFRQAEIGLLYRQSHIERLLEQDNFQNLCSDYYEGEDLERFQTAVSYCHSFVENFSKDYANILFYGTVGTGKSFLSGCIAKELLDRCYSVIYFSAPELFSLLSDAMFHNGEYRELQSSRSDLYRCDLLIIDDLGIELTNNAVALQFFSLLNERHLANKSTVISTNLLLSELEERYDERIFSRLAERFHIFKLTGPDIRRLKNRK